jgi:hypothetical protein
VGSNPTPSASRFAHSVRKHHDQNDAAAAGAVRAAPLYRIAAACMRGLPIWIECLLKLVYGQIVGPVHAVIGAAHATLRMV